MLCHHFFLPNSTSFCVSLFAELSSASIPIYRGKLCVQLPFFLALQACDNYALVLCYLFGVVAVLLLLILLISCGHYFFLYLCPWVCNNLWPCVAFFFYTPLLV